ncbi:hydroxyacylglutathione hydrolase [Yunchengibacter salinarum]|uniref:hydroxyacylglutathione hydrolase n=1 Tax=Yunchengibacter salinarum TaxID=3133399 RepID=UPI0035B5829C
MDIVQIPVLRDNYVYLIHDAASGETAVVDPAVAEPVEEALNARGWALTQIINTHHHWDHTGANETLKGRYGARVTGPAGERDRIPGIDVAVAGGDHIHVGDREALVIDVPGHTSGHIAYHFASEKALFCGDTLFAMGCGRLFEGTPDQMWRSLTRLMDLPDDTRAYCAHEYTLANGTFALSVEPDNDALRRRMEAVKALREAGKPTIPTTIGEEKDTNPFLRPMSPEIQQEVGLTGAALTKVFAEVRHRKDTF